MNTNTHSPFPILTKDRLTLRQLALNEQNNIFTLRSDEEINKYLGRQPSKTIADAINFINNVNNNIEQNNSLNWAITFALIESSDSNGN